MVKEIPHEKSTKNKHLPLKKIQLKIYILVISDSLSKIENDWMIKDKSARIALDILKMLEYYDITTDVVADDVVRIKNAIENIITLHYDVIVTIGGTGISPRDVTIEAVEALIDKKLPGFGEIFRQKTYQDLGSLAIMTRAFAGLKEKSLIICLPGSPNAVKSGLELISSEFQHIFHLLSKK